MSRGKKALLALLVASAVLTAVIGAFTIFSRLEKAGQRPPEGAGLSLSREASDRSEDAPPRDMIYYEGEPYEFNEDLSTILILGVDDYGLSQTGSYRNSSQADFLLLAVLDRRGRTCSLIQLDRDTMTDIPTLGGTGQLLGYTTGQLALAHTYGSGLEDSCENTLHAVSRFLYDIPIDNYFCLTMDAITILTDLAGGVTVTVEDDFTGVDDTLIQGSAVTLTGEHAEHFVRARSSMSEDATNIARMRRQRTYLSSLLDALRAAAADDPALPLEAYAAVADYLVTDCSVIRLAGYAEQLSGYAVSDIVTPKGEAVRGERFMEFYVDDDDLRDLVVHTFFIPADAD